VYSAAVRGDLEITYYQWTPLILAVQAFFFLVPGLLWKVGTLVADQGVGDTTIE